MDTPNRPSLSVSSPRSASSGTSSVAIMAECKRVGSWTVEDAHSAFALMGSVVIDLRQAQFAQQVVVINANAVMGEVKIIVDAATTVVVEGTGVMGEYSEQRARVPYAPLQGGPVVRVRGFALMGSVHVQRKGPPGEARRKALGWMGH